VVVVEPSKRVMVCSTTQSAWTPGVAGSTSRTPGTHSGRTSVERVVAICKSASRGPSLQNGAMSPFAPADSTKEVRRGTEGVKSVAQSPGTGGTMAEIRMELAGSGLRPSTKAIVSCTGSGEASSAPAMITMKRAASGRRKPSHPGGGCSSTRRREASGWAGAELVTPKSPRQENVLSSEPVKLVCCPHESTVAIAAGAAKPQSPARAAGDPSPCDEEMKPT
jgi:hypothetical protein